MNCKSCKHLEPVVGGDKLIYFCNKYKMFIQESALFLIGRFCVSYKERRGNVVKTN